MTDWKNYAVDEDFHQIHRLKHTVIRAS